MRADNTTNQWYLLREALSLARVFSHKERFDLLLWVELASNVAHALRNQTDICVGQITLALAKQSKIDRWPSREIWDGIKNSRVFWINKGRDLKFLNPKSPQYLELILEALAIVRMKLNGPSDHQEIYDILDSIHCLPDILLQSWQDEPAYWYCYIGLVRKKWDRSFLIRKERELFPEIGFRRELKRIIEWFCRPYYSVRSKVRVRISRTARPNRPPTLIHVECFEKDQPEAFASGTKELKHLSDDFGIDPTYNIFGKELRVVKAEPATKAEFIRTGQLKIVVEKFRNKNVFPQYPYDTQNVGP